MALKSNVLANFLGQGWRLLMSLAFVPVYIQFIGIEAYGLIGIFAMLQAWLVLLDMGMKPALGREMARFTGGGHNPQSIRTLLRSIETISIGIALLLMLGLWAASSWLATNWVQAEALPVSMIRNAFILMGAISALQFIESIYISSIAGLQQQVLQNIVTSTMATVRALGAVAVLMWVSPTINAFFVWQVVVSLLTTVVTAFFVYRLLPAASGPVRFSLPALSEIWRYALGMLGITLLALLLTQVDKLLLSRMLPLSEFAFYALAGAVVSALYALSSPITTAYYPRMTEIATRGDSVALSSTYHAGAQLVTVFLGTAAVTLIVFGEELIRVWTWDAEIVRNVAPLTNVLAIGTLLHGLMWMPYHLQLAHGWTSLTLKVNSVAVLILVPAIWFIVPMYGAIGAAWVWVLLNFAYVMVTIYFMHRRLLTTEKWRWYLKDVALPLLAAFSTALICHAMMPAINDRIVLLCWLIFCSGLILLATVLAAPVSRLQLTQRFQGKTSNLIG